MSAFPPDVAAWLDDDAPHASNGTHPPHTAAGDGASVIARFNAVYTPTELLDRYGYTYVEREKRWLAPTSESKLPGVVVFEDGRIFSHHASDPLADRHAHDAFDLFRILEHGGVARNAVKAAADLLGMNSRKSGADTPDPSDPSDEHGADSDTPRDPEPEGAQAQGEGPRLFGVTRILEGEPPPPPVMLVADLVLDADIGAITAAGGSMKSTTALHTAACVAIGRPVAGSLMVNRPGVVLYIALEDPADVVRMQFDAHLAGLACTPEERALAERNLLVLDGEHALNLVTDTVRLGLTAKAVGAVLVVIDPLANAIPGTDENDNSLASAVMSATRRHVCHVAGCAVLFIHHERKKGKDGGDSSPNAQSVRGASSWVNSARLVFNLTKTNDRLTLTATKSNRVRADLVHNLVVTIATDPANTAHWLSCTITDANKNAGAWSEGFTAGSARPLTDNERALLEVLDDFHEPGMRWAYSRWEKESGVRDSKSFRRARKSLLDAGLVLVVPTGGKSRNGSPELVYQLTDEGRALLPTREENSPIGGKGAKGAQPYKGAPHAQPPVPTGSEHDRGHAPIGGTPDESPEEDAV